MKKIIGAVFCVLLLVCQVFAVDKNEAMFIKGNVKDKTASVKNASKEGNTKLAIDGINFAVSTQKTIGTDEEVDALAIACIDCFIKNLDSYNRVEIANILCECFNVFETSKVKTKVIEGFMIYPNPANVSLLNSYVSEKMQNQAEMDEVLLSAIKSLKLCGNNTSFNLLFIADILNVWPSYNDVIVDSYGSLANDCEDDILKILSRVPFPQKNKILTRISENEKISKKILGEVAENSLSESIYNIGDGSGVTKDQIQLQLNSLKIIADTKWTRAAPTVTASFAVLTLEYNNGLITDEEFAQAIGNICAVSDSETGKVLSSYLDYLNKSMEKGNAPSQVVVLAVINGLGGLGDKTAFDYLLYVTYLDYSEEIINAARISLAKLKW